MSTAEKFRQLSASLQCVIKTANLHAALMFFLNTIVLERVLNRNLAKILKNNIALILFIHTWIMAYTIAQQNSILDILKSVEVHV
jgi:hypothetical protein